MSEAALWRKLRAALAPYGRLERVENRVRKSTPDVFYALRGAGCSVSGWLELKYLEKFPARAATPVRLRSLTLDQVLWHEEWSQAGIHVGTLLEIRVRREMVLLGPKQLRSILEGSTTTADIVDNCLRFSLPLNHAGAAGLIQCLTLT